MHLGTHDLCQLPVENLRLSYRDFQMTGLQLRGVTNCPHCGVANPVLMQMWRTQGPLVRADGLQPSQWAAYGCTTCGGIVTAKGTPGINANNPFVVQIFPDVWEADEVVPAPVRHYLNQAHQTRHAPDASVLMSASSIDAMLKEKGLREGSLYHRIDEAVGQGLLTQTMADWAHRVRLDANGQRHADPDVPRMTDDDAKRAFEFAKALTEYLYVLPSRMPPEEA